jgi:Zn-dependent alcohol dehydrogenase
VASGNAGGILPGRNVATVGVAKIAQRDPSSEAQEFVAAAESKLVDMQRSSTLRSEPYRLALGILISSVKAIVATVAASRAPAHMEAELMLAIQRGAKEGVAAEARSLTRQIDRRSALWLGVWIGLAFIAGAALTGAILLVGNSQWEAATARVYAAMPVCRPR